MLLLSGCSECETEYYNLKHVSKIAKMNERGIFLFSRTKLLLIKYLRQC